jgi:hypothetical protein
MSVEQRLRELEAAVAGLLQREAEREAEHAAKLERARRQELRDSVKAGRGHHWLDLDESDPQVQGWYREVDRAVSRRRVA